MSGIANIRVHPSQFPENVLHDLLDSLRSRKINHKFHYDSVKQTQKWLELHQAYSPSRTDRDCLQTYEKSFDSVAKKISTGSVHLIGMGCGGGQKDSLLLKRLKSPSRKLFYTPADVSVAMVLVARQVAKKFVPEENCYPFVCDFASAELSQINSREVPSDAQRIFTFFGMIPNFEPNHILPKISKALRRNDLLLFSANLAPGDDYPAGMKRILPLYDNRLTRDWLLTFLFDLGVEKDDGELRFEIQECVRDSVTLHRVVATFHFARKRATVVHGEKFLFRSGEKFRLFFSYRHTPQGVARLLKRHGIFVLEQWITKSEEEGVFLCRKSRSKGA